MIDRIYAFRAALRIPNAIRNLLGEGTLSASFIPVYAALNQRSDKQAARALAVAASRRSPWTPGDGLNGAAFTGNSQTDSGPFMVSSPGRW